jgi:hypothetical protein
VVETRLPQLANAKTEIAVLRLVCKYSGTGNIIWKHKSGHSWESAIARPRTLYSKAVTGLLRPHVEQQIEIQIFPMIPKVQTPTRRNLLYSFTRDFNLSWFDRLEQR